MSYHDTRLARRMTDEEFAAEFEKALTGAKDLDKVDPDDVCHLVWSLTSTPDSKTCCGIPTSETPYEPWLDLGMDTDEDENPKPGDVCPNCHRPICLACIAAEHPK